MYDFHIVDLPYIKDINWPNAQSGSILAIGQKVDSGAVQLITSHGESVGVDLLPFEYEGSTFFYVRNVNSLAAEANHFLAFLNSKAWHDKPTVSDIVIEMQKHNQRPMSRNKLIKILDHLSFLGAIEEESHVAPQGGRPTKRYHIKNALKIEDYI